MVKLLLFGFYLPIFAIHQYRKFNITKMEKDKLYYKVFLEVALVNSRHVFGFINISHIPYEKF